MKREQKIPLGSKVQYHGCTTPFETIVVGFDTEDGQYMVLTDVPGCTISPYGTVYTRDNVIIDIQYCNRPFLWALACNLVFVGSREDGSRCVKCGEFASMAQPNIKHTSKGVGFACWQCRSTAKWWLDNNEWTQS